jgi:hypothetical protein
MPDSKKSALTKANKFYIENIDRLLNQMKRSADDNLRKLGQRLDDLFFKNGGINKPVDARSKRMALNRIFTDKKINDYLEQVMVFSSPDSDKRLAEFHEVIGSLNDLDKPKNSVAYIASISRVMDNVVDMQKTA